MAVAIEWLRQILRLLVPSASSQQQQEEPNDSVKQAYLAVRPVPQSGYKPRWLLLSKSAILIYSGTKEKKSKLKKRLDLKHIVLVELLKDEAAETPYAFQIGQADSSLLYVLASSAEQRDEWLSAIRKCCKSVEARWAEHYHPGARLESCWSCCQLQDPGCSPTSGAIVAPGSPSPIPKPAQVVPVSQGKTVVALYNFEAVEEGDLCLVEGEAYEVVDNSREHWWQVRNKHGQMGFIPSNYVEATPGLTKHEWYAVDLTRQKCETVLREDNKDGCFIVRNSSTQGMYTLSLLAKVPGGPQVKHYHIKRNEEGSYFLSEKHTFESIEQLVLFHKVNSGGLATRLKNPPKNLVRPAPTPPGLGHGKWEIDHSELELLEEVGSGQFGVVRKAKWRGHLYVAVKMMKEGTMSEKEFIKEAQLMTAIQHPNLVRLFGVCSQTRPIFIVTEYMKYGSLLTYLRQHTNRLINKPGSLLDMCLQVCSGMAYLELCNYIHRDLAARNCLVTSGNTVKVADFGLARWVKDDEYQSSGGAKFPIKWAPPEVLNFTRFSSKSDVWAYGVLMWEVFTCGKMPYGRMANAEVARYVVQDGRRLERPRNCPPEVYELMTSCWHYSPPDRPAFRTLKLKLEAILEDTV